MKQKAKVFGSGLNPADTKREKDAISNISHSLSSQLTTADVTFSHVGTERLFTRDPLRMSFGIILGHRTAAE